MTIYHWYHNYKCTLIGVGSKVTQLSLMVNCSECLGTMQPLIIHLQHPEHGGETQCGVSLFDLAAKKEKWLHEETSKYKITCDTCKELYVKPIETHISDAPSLTIEQEPAIVDTDVKQGDHMKAVSGHDVYEHANALIAVGTYMSLDSYTHMRDMAIEGAYQHVLYTTEDSRPGVYFKARMEDISWFYLRISQSHPAKMSVGMLPNPGLDIFTNPAYNGQMSVASIEKHIIMLEKKQASAKKQYTTYADQINSVRLHSPEIADALSEKLTGISSSTNFDDEIDKWESMLAKAIEEAKG